MTSLTTLRRCRLAERRKIRDPLGDGATCADQIGDEAFVDFTCTFILGAVAKIVAFGENTPYFRSEAQGVGQNLKN
jgi:hypothetical protein